MNSNNPFLAALPFEGGQDWQDKVAKDLDVNGLRAERRGADVALYPAEVSGKVPSGHQYLNGFRVSSLWVSPIDRNVAVIPRRYWLKPNGQNENKPEHTFLNGRFAPPIDLGAEITRLKEVLAALSLLDGFGDSPLRLSPVNEVKGPLASLQIGIERLPCDQDLNKSFKDVGFHFVPKDFSIAVVPVSGTSDFSSKQFVSALMSCFQARKAQVSVESCRFESLRPRTDQAVVFLLPGVFKSKPINPEIINMFSMLESRGQQFRRAYDTDNFQFSVPEQAPSILQSAGGVPYLSIAENAKPSPWTLGIDLSNPTKGSPRLCGSLVSPEGTLVHSWLQDHRQDETFSSTHLRLLLHTVVEYLPKNAAQHGLLILRDGRLFEKENYRIYKEELGLPITLAEFRKGGNPPILTPTYPGLPQDSFFGFLPISNNKFSTAFLVTFPSVRKGRFGSVFKLHWRDDWNELGLESRDFAATIKSLVNAPGLGCKARKLPAPIYWADGIAGSTAEDLRFRGQRISIL